MNTEKKENKRVTEPEELTLADIVENEDDKKILKPIKNKNGYIIGTANENNVYVRKDPDDFSEIVFILKKGKTVIVDQSSIYKDYYLITVETTVGYVLKDKITIE